MSNVTYIIENRPFKVNGFLIELCLSFASIDRPVTMHVVKRNLKGKLKVISSQTLTPRSLGSNIFTSQDNTLEAVRVTRQCFFAFSLPKNSSQLVLLEKQKSTITYKKGNVYSEEKEKNIKMTELIHQCTVLEKSGAFINKNFEKGNFLSDFGNVQFEIGDYTSDKFEFSIKAKRIDEACYFRIYLEKSLILNFKPKFEAGLITHLSLRMRKKCQFDEVVIYPYQNAKINKDNSVEIEFICNSKPRTNVFTFNLEHVGVEFLKQHPYNEQPETAEDRLAGVINRTETHGYNINGIVKVSMPDENINSYAVYSTDRKNVYNTREDADLKQSGKIAHIERIKIIDVNEAWVWGDQNIDSVNNTYTIEVPQTFLDTCEYPIRIDPNMGYTTLGGTAFSNDDTIFGIRGDPNEYGLVTGFYVGMGADWASGQNIKMAVYDDDNDILISPQSVEDNTGHASTAWVNLAVAGGADVFINDREHLIAAWFDSNSPIMRDSGGEWGIAGYYDVAYGAWPDRPSILDSGYYYSTYVVYDQVTPSFFGITDTLTNVDNRDTAVYIGGISPGASNMKIRKIRLRVQSSGTAAVALYTGGTVSDPTGATRRTEAHNYPVDAGWNEIEIPDHDLASSTLTWIGIAVDSSNGFYYSTDSGDSNDFQSANGFWEQSSPTDFDETGALPTSPGSGAFVSRWIQVNAVYTADSSIDGSGASTLDEFTTAGIASMEFLGYGASTLEEFTTTGVGGMSYNHTGASTLAGFTTSANGNMSFELSGASTLEEFTTSGSAFFEYTVLGASTLAGFTTSANGYMSFELSGASTLEEFTTSSSAVQEFTLSGASTLEELTTSANGNMSFLLSGASNVPNFTTLGQAFYGTNVEGASTLEEFTTSGTIEHGFLLNGASTLEEFTTSSNAYIEFKITGASNLERFTTEGQGNPLYPLSGASTLEEFITSGNAIIQFTGYGASTLVRFTTVANGGMIYDNSGASTLDEFTTSANGNMSFDLSGASTLDEFTTAGTAYMEFTGSGASTLDEFTTAGTAYMEFTGSGASTLDEFTTAGIAYMEFTGSGASTFEEFTTSGVIYIEKTLSGASTLEELTTEGVATFEFTGSGASTLEAFTTEGEAVNQLPILGYGASTLEVFTTVGRAYNGEINRFENTIVNYLKTDGTLLSFISTYASEPAIFIDYAPEDADKPYIVLDVFTNETASPVLDQFTIDFDIYSLRTYTRQIRQIVERIIFTMDKAVINTDYAYHAIRFYRGSSGMVSESGSKFTHYNVRMNARASRKLWMENIQR